MMEREALVLECATRLGVDWARALCDATWQDQREVAGGFPGTIPEARARVAAYLHHELTRQGLSPLEPAELSRAVKAAYANARRDWLTAGRDTKPPSPRTVRLARRERDQ